MEGYRRFDQRLEGHPTPVVPWVDVATGSLGQGLPDGVGIALAGKYLEQAPYRVWVLTGDSELAEGIGRASCRERVEISGGAVAVHKQKRATVTVADRGHLQDGNANGRNAW